MISYLLFSDDILADSDSDEELQEDILMDSNDTQVERPKKKILGKHEKYIYEDSENIIDLVDIKAMSSIGCKYSSYPYPFFIETNTDNFNSFIIASKPSKHSVEAVGIKKIGKDPNRGFKMDFSGKLIIEEPKRGDNKASDTESDDDFDTIGENGKEKTMSSAESDCDEELAETTKAKTRKRKSNSSLSQASGKSGVSSKYVTGGKGIHRPLNEAASVRSGYTNVSSKTDAKSTVNGHEYRAKKSKGDVKKKGALDPYAYIPLSRNTLNKRKRAKHSRQFKNIVQTAEKGAAAGSKRRRE